MNHLEKIAAEEAALEKEIFGTPQEEDDQSSNETPTEQDAPPREELVTPKEAPSAPPDEDWEKRYKNLRASRDYKLLEAKEQIADLMEQVQKLETELEDAKKQLNEAAPMDPFKDVLTEEDREALGDATVDVLKKVTQKVTENATADLRKELDAAKEARRKQKDKDLKQAKGQGYQLFLDKLATMVPDWKAINEDKGFIEFCHNTYDLDGSLIADNFRLAEARRDAVAIARYMLDYKGRPKVEDPLEDHVSPTGVSASEAPKEDKRGSKIWSRKEIDKFYDDLNRGRFKGTREEAQKLEREIDKAVMEGRIRG
jgi:hypothetical protein